MAAALLAACQPRPHRGTPGGALADGSPAASTNPASPTPLWLSSPTGFTAAQHLTALAEHLRDADSDTSHGDYTCIHTQKWARAATMIGRFDNLRCRASSGAGQETERRLPDRPGLLPLPDGHDRGEFDQVQPTTRTYIAGQMPLDVPEPIPTDVAELTDALLYHRPAPPDEPDYLTNRIVDLATGQALTRAQRAALLRVLAMVPGLQYLGPSTDLAGRTGPAFQQHTDTRTLTLVFADTGELLAFQDVVDRRPVGTQVRPGLWTYLLLLDIRHQPAPANPTTIAGSTP